MITEEEFYDVQIGDYIQIVDEWNEYTDENLSGDMDYLLGKTFEVTRESTEATVEKRSGKSDFVIQFGGGWVWSLNLHCIEKVIKRTENLKSIDDKSLEEMLKGE